MSRGRRPAPRVYLVCTDSDHQHEPGFVQDGHIVDELVLRRTPDGEYYLTRAGSAARYLSSRKPTHRVLGHDVLRFRCSCGKDVQRKSGDLMPMVLARYEEAGAAGVRLPINIV